MFLLGPGPMRAGGVSTYVFKLMNCSTALLEKGGLHSRAIFLSASELINLKILLFQHQKRKNKKKTK